MDVSEGSSHMNLRVIITSGDQTDGSVTAHSQKPGAGLNYSSSHIHTYTYVQAYRVAAVCRLFDTEANS